MENIGADIKIEIDFNGEEIGTVEDSVVKSEQVLEFNYQTYLDDDDIPPIGTQEMKNNDFWIEDNEIIIKEEPQEDTTLCYSTPTTIRFQPSIHGESVAGSELMHQVSNKCDSKPLLKCKHCTFIVKSKFILEQHIKSIHGELQIGENAVCKLQPKSNQFGVVKCQFCDFLTTKPSYLKVHVNSKHTKMNCYKCEKCDFKSFLIGSVRAHAINKHSQPVVGTLFCKFCNYKTERQLNLKLHMRQKHAEQTVLHCKLCGYTTEGKFRLKSHMNLIHKVDGKLKCEQCPYETRRVPNFEKHLKTKHPNVE